MYANPSDDLFYLLASSDPLRLLTETEGGGMGVPVFLFLAAAYGFRVWLFPVIAESWLGLLSPGVYWDAYKALDEPVLNDDMWNTYIDPDGSQPFP